MNWKDLKFYKTIEKAELNDAKKSIDLIHIIHLDSRGSWNGSSNNLKTEFAIVSIYDTDIFIQNFEPISGSYIENLEPKLKNFYQITQEFNLFAEYLTKKIIEIILPHFDKYLSSRDVIDKGIQIGKTKNLNHLCLLSNQEIDEDLKLKKKLYSKD